MTGSFTLEAEFGEQGVARAVVRPLRASTPADRDSLLTDGVFAVIEQLARASGLAAGGRSIIDLRVPERMLPDAMPGTEAFIEAVRGLVQSLTLESGPDSPACTLLISSEEQQSGRDRTVDYLEGAHGGFSRGTTYDLREKAL